jgi:hypothetical protein
MAVELRQQRTAERPTRLDLETLIQAATLAPSPDNNQPWLFESRPDGELLLLHDRTRALPSDVDDMFSMIALGAALENLCLAAGQRAWRALVSYPKEFGPDVEGREVVATIRFAEGGTADSLASFLEQRCCNRKPYPRRPVPEESLLQIDASISAQENSHLHWLSDRPSIRKLAWIVAAADRIRFEHRPFHAELFHQLRFTPQAAESTRDGLDVRCLELPLGAATILRWLRHWPLMRQLNRFGLSRLMSLTSAMQVWRTGTIGLLTTTDTSRLGYLQAGRAMQRAWLTATKLGLAFHPLGSVPIFLAHLARGTTGSLPVHHQHRVEGLARRFEKLVPQVREQGLVLLFRLGEATAGGVRSLRGRPLFQTLTS